MSVIHHNNITDLSNRSGTSEEARNADVQGQTLTGEVSREACSSGDATNSRRLRRVAPAEHRDAGLPVRRARAARRLGTLQSDRTAHSGRERTRGLLPPQRVSSEAAWREGRNGVGASLL